MVNGYIKMKLLSDTCFGTGMSISGIVDLEVFFDDFGIPFVPSKRILGILREEAELLNSLSGNKYSEIINNLFGISGNDESGKLSLRNGTIKELEAFRKGIKIKKEDKKIAPMLTYEAVTSMFTTTRTQTSINENGVAKQESLRVTRVINKDNIFFFPLNVDNCSKIESDFLIDVISCVRHVGSNRNRGLGLVKCDFVNKPQETRDLPPTINANSFIFIIELLSDCIFENNYITAKSMLGICVSLFLKQKGLTKANAHFNSEFSDLFLNGKVIISDAYPSTFGDISVPLPKCFKFEKGNEKMIFNLLNKIDSSKQYSNPDFQFCEIEESIKYKEKIKKTFSFHHKRDADLGVGSVGQSGEFFQYESVKSGMIFSGEISSTESNIKILSELLHAQTTTIGKSRKSQYGQCKITIKDKQIEETENEFDYDDFENGIPILFLSDLVVLNKYGQPSISIEDIERYMKAELDKDITIIKEKVFLDIATHSGFNSKRKMPDPVFSCIAKGSVITISPEKFGDKIEKFIEKIKTTSIGEYTRTGCGKMCILPSFDKETFSTSSKENDPPIEKCECKYLDLLIEKNRKEYYKNIIKVEIFKPNINTEYFKKIEDYLKNTEQKSQLRFLYNICKTNTSIEEIIKQFSYVIEKEKSGSRDKKPYKELFDLLKLNEEEIIENSVMKIPNPTSEIEISEYYCFILAKICQKVALERRGK